MEFIKSLLFKELSIPELKMLSYNDMEELIIKIDLFTMCDKARIKYDSTDDLVEMVADIIEEL
jgi:hypothetical protein